ncbi:uncharacterized protein RHO17_006309 [Thomomys bottae]
MMKKNQSSVSKFLLLGLPIRPKEQGLYRALFLAMYLITVLGNLLILLLIRLDSRLHTPMYFFLSHLAFSDISLSSIVVPQMLVNMQTRQQFISYEGCISQMYFFVLFGCLDNFLLALMAYDRYAAICHPLRYVTLMRKELCVSLVAGSWFFCCVHALLHTLLLIQLPFCADRTIANFFCDLTALLKLSCSDISINELAIFTEGGVLFTLPLSIILGSYICIGTTVLRIPSTKRFFKTFSTCGSHLFVVSLYYGTLAGVYFSSSSQNSDDKDIIASVIYTVVTPMLNPFIYSLRNRDIKQALDILVHRASFFISSPVNREFFPKEESKIMKQLYLCVSEFKMEMQWQKKRSMSSESEFILLGLPIRPEEQGLFYALFLAMYLTTVLGNLLIILLIRLDSRLHTPMYFFLSHLAFSDVSLSSVTVPKMLINNADTERIHLISQCIIQECFFLIFGGLDSFLLTSMAYDRYVVICHPLYYTIIMRQNLCFLLVIVSWALSIVRALVHTLLLVRLSFLRDNTLPHIFCDLSALLNLSSSDTTVNELVILTVGTVVITLLFLCILVSYGHIGATILRAPSVKGICKALSTCGSHLSVVSLYYGAIIGLYFFPSPRNTNDKDVIMAVLYSLVIPMLNPFIYSLRNQDMKGALGNILSRRNFSL